MIIFTNDNVVKDALGTSAGAAAVGTQNSDAKYFVYGEHVCGVK